MSSILNTIPSRGDLEDLVALRSDAAIASTLGGPLDMDGVEAMVERWLESFRIHGAGPWIFRYPGSGEFVGYAGLLPTDPANKGEFELLYAVRKRLWGRGLGTQIAGTALADARDRLGSPKIVAWCLTTNAGSRRILEKLEFNLVRTVSRAGSPHLEWMHPL